MQISEIITALNQEISRLEQVRNLLANEATGEQTVKRRGRPKGSVNKTVTAKEETSRLPPKRQMSEAGRARIAAAQKKRWAVAKQASKSEPTSPKKTSPRKKAAKPGRPSKTTAAPIKKSVRQRPAQEGPAEGETNA